MQSRKFCYYVQVLEKISARLVALLFRSFTAREVFVAQVQEIREKYPERPLAFVVLSGGYLEFLAIRSFLATKFGENFELRTATRLPVLLQDGFRALCAEVFSRLHLTQKPESRLARCVRDLQAGRPVLLNFSDQERRKPFEKPIGELELDYLLRHKPDLLVVPVVFLWRRQQKFENPQATHFTDYAWKGLTEPFHALWTLFLGDPSAPTSIRKLFILLRQYSGSALRPIEPVDPVGFTPATLRRKIIVNIQQERRVIIGPTYKSPRLIEESILQHESFKALIKNLAVETDTSEAYQLKKASRYFFELASSYSYSVLEFGSFLLTWVFNTIFEGVTLNEADFKTLRERSKEGPLVLIPAHKSYVDFLLLSYVLFRKDVLPPHVAAGMNLNFFPFGWFAKGGGAFFIRRTFRGNVLYGEILKRYIAALLSNRFNVEFFIEGMRSRSGKLSAPKYGMLGMIVNAYLDGLISEKVRIVPVSITYDRVTEDKSHKRELEGGAKVNESFLGLLKATRVLFKKYGKVHVRFCDAIPLETWVADKVGEGKQSQDVRKLAVQKLAFEVCHRINRGTPLTGMGIVCSILLASPKGEMMKADLEAWILRVRDDLKSWNVPLTPELEADFLRCCRRSLARLIDEKVIDRFLVYDGLLLRIPDRQRVTGLYYKNSVVHAFLLPAVAGIAKDDPKLLLDLRTLLQFEFFFPEKESYLKQVLEYRDQPGVRLDFYAQMLGDMLDNLELGLLGLASNTDTEMDLRDWKNKLMRFGEQELVGKKIYRREAVNTQSFAAFLDLAQNRGWLKAQPVITGGKEIPRYKVQKIQDIQSSLDKVRHFRTHLGTAYLLVSQPR